jgi:long-subunit acyl-CoA synthetase (AMP-forming)
VGDLGRGPRGAGVERGDPGCLESVDAGAGSRTILLTDEDVDVPPAGPGDVAALFYTSGTTGGAREVSLSHAHLVFKIDTRLGADLVSEEDSVLLTLPLHHVYPFVMGMPPERVSGRPYGAVDG